MSETRVRDPPGCARTRATTSKRPVRNRGTGFIAATAARQPGAEMTVSRRDFLKTGMAAGAAGLLGGGLLSGCGTGNVIRANTVSTAGKPRQGGTLRAGLTGGPSAGTPGALKAITKGGFPRNG